MKKTIFGVVAALVLGLGAQAALAQVYLSPVSPQYPPAGMCPQPYSNLYQSFSDRSAGGQVAQLQQFLSMRYGNQAITGYFGVQTAANVARFQREQGVWPVTGGVGPLTRAALARLCGSVPPQPAGDVSITNVSGPNSLSVGQSGTWQITTAAPQGSYVSLNVRWGDENQSPFAAPSAQSAYTSQQNTFTHSYQAAGTYTITFTATDQFGRVSSASATVAVNGSGTSSGFSATPTSGQAPLAVAFSINTVTGNDISTLYIDFGDGQTGKPQTIYCFAAPCIPAMTASHTYTAPGTYTAKLLRDNNYCAPGMYCTLMYREPTVVGTVVISVSGGASSSGISAYPTYGSVPLTVTYTPAFTGYYAVDFGDGTSASLLQGSVQHTYWARGTYTAQFSSDAPCLHSNPRCMLAQQLLGSATITAY